MEKGLHDSLFPRLYTLLKGQMVETLELPTFSGRAGSMDYTITKMKINNLDFGRFNIDLKKGEIVIIAEGIELSSKCHLKAWSSKIVKIKSSIDPTLKITNLNIEITIKLGKDDVEYTIATVHVGTFEMGSDNTGIKNKIFKNLANIASINESARKIFEKVLENQLKSKITKILKKKLYEENKIPSYRKKALWIPDDAVDNCMKCKVVFTWYRRKVFPYLVKIMIV